VFCCRAATHPDTTVFDFRLSRRSYRLNKLCASRRRVSSPSASVSCCASSSRSARRTARAYNPRAKGWFDKVKEFFEG
jgi:hypothetical protein